MLQSPTHRGVALFALIFLFCSSLFLIFLLTAQGVGVSVEQSIVPGADASEYVSLARTMLAEGRFAMAPDAEPEYFRTPGYPLFVAAILALFGTVAAIPFIQAALVAGSGVLIYLLGRRWFSPVAGLGAAALYAINPSVITTAYTALSDTLFVFLLLLAVYLLSAGGWRMVVLGAAVAGCMVLVRPLGLYLLPVIALIPLARNLPGWKGGLSMSALFLAVAMLVLVPWMARNYTLAGHFSLSSLSSYNVLFFNVLEFEAERRGVAKDEVRQELYTRLGVSDWMELRSFRYADAEAALIKEYVGPRIAEYAFFHGVKTVPFFVSSSIEAGNRALYTFGIKAGDAPADINISSLFIAGEWRAGVGALFQSWPELLERVLWLVCWALAAIFVATAAVKKLPHAALYAVLFVVCLAVAALTGPLAMPRYRLPAEPFLFLLAVHGGIVMWQLLARLYGRQTHHS